MGYQGLVPPGPALAVLLLPLLPGCAGLGGIKGAWTGSCDFSDGTYGDTVYLDLQIAHDHGRRIDGTARVTTANQGVQDIPLSGEHTLTDAAFDLTIPADGQDLQLHFEGQRNLDHLSGSCELWVPGATSPVMGVGDLRR